MRPKNLLITGVNGFLARAVIRQSSDNWRLLGLTRPGTTVISPRIDIGADSLEQLIAVGADVDVIMHLAACIPTPASPAPKELISVNVDLVSSLVRLYPHAHHLLASSVSVYAPTLNFPITLQSSLTKDHAYGLSKLEAEKIVRTAARHTIIRFSSLIGAGMKAHTFIPAMISASKRGKIPLLGDGKRLQNYLDVRDAAAMCLQATNHHHSSTRLGVGEKSFSNKNIAEMLSELTMAEITYHGEDNSPSFIYDLHDNMDLGRAYIPVSETLKNMVSA